MQFQSRFISSVRLTFFLVFLGQISCDDSKSTMFKQISADDSGINFKNTLVINGEPSILEFEYMYNGAGAAIADFDKDGLQDLFFTGNMVSNRLFRNIGSLKFQDITENAGVGSENWSNGVAIVDINQDGYPDIYVSKGGPRNSTNSQRANLLFINNGLVNNELHFTEEASKWGIADTGYSVQANFFDYDKDGDLDMYLLSNALVDFNRNTSRPKDRTGKAPSADKLFKNNGNGTFTNVSKEAKILIEGFGLGVEVCDMNQDGWPDIYVSNDFLTDDFLYINQKDGTFNNEIGSYMKHLSFNGMGNDIADINNDGLMDIVVLDMLPPDNKRWKLTMMGNNYDEFQNHLDYGYQPQYIRNTLQLNNGNGSFSEIGQFAGISATEWSWSALFADYDNNGDKDLFITNGYRQDITNMDFMVYGANILTMGTEEANRKERLKELNKLPGIKVNNYFFKNQGGLKFEDISKDAGFSNPTYSNGSAYGDLDNDGDLDLITNNIDDYASLHINTTNSKISSNYIKFKFQGEAPNLDGIGSEVTVFYQGKIQKQYYTPYRGSLSTVESKLHFGLGSVGVLDSIEVKWPNGHSEILKNIKANKEVLLKQQNSKPTIKKSFKDSEGLFRKIDSIGLTFEHKEDDFVDYKIQPLLPHMHSRNGPGMAVGDTNGNGMDDIYIGGAAQQHGSLFIQQANHEFLQENFPDESYEDMGSLFFDADNDDDQDLYIVSGGSTSQKGDTLYRDRMYENKGGVFTKVEALPAISESGSVVVGADYDKDGDIDLFVGSRVIPGEYPLAPSSSLLINESSKGKIQFKKNSQTIQRTFDSLGMVTAALWTDFNNDSWRDLIVVGEFMSIRFFQNNSGTLEEITEKTNLLNTHGWWNSITSGDFDNDGDSDYVLGNLGLNSRYKATASEPLCIYAKDYDKNGQIDPVMCFFIDGKNYVAHSRNDLIDQINAMRGRFRTFSEYADATFEESFTEEEISTAQIFKCETFASSYIENLGNGKFKISPLPHALQIAPVYGMTTGDFNSDGNLDILANGNFYSGEVFGGRYDASIGWFLSGDGHGNFVPVHVGESGFSVDGDAKSMVNLFTDDRELILSGINNGKLNYHVAKRKNLNSYSAKPNDIAVIFNFKKGKSQKVELHYGSGYLSQGSRNLIVPDSVKSLLVIDSKGLKTEILIEE